jgi:hypothetical protein
MKIRSGFVSNSSTSSFVILGVKISENKFRKITGNIDLYEPITKSYCGLTVSDDGNGNILIGIGDKWSDTDTISDGSFSMRDIDKLKENLEKHGLMSAGKFGLYYGTRSC